MKRNGFTLIEMLVVIAITALLSGLAIVYSHVGQNQVALSVESSKVAQLILEAKDLSIATYSDKKNTCGYGVHFSYSPTGQGQYSLFEYDLPTGGSNPPTVCPSLASTTATGYMTGPSALQMNEYAFSSWNIVPAQGVKLVSGGSASGTIMDILFYPPNPFTLISFDGQTFNDSYNAAPGVDGGNVYLETVDGSASRAINVSFAGQVNL